MSTVSDAELADFKARNDANPNSYYIQPQAADSQAAFAATAAEDQSTDQEQPPGTPDPEYEAGYVPPVLSTQNPLDRCDSLASKKPAQVNNLYGYVPDKYLYCQKANIIYTGVRSNGQIAGQISFTYVIVAVPNAANDLSGRKVKYTTYMDNFYTAAAGGLGSENNILLSVFMSHFSSDAGANSFCQVRDEAFPQHEQNSPRSSTWKVVDQTVSKWRTDPKYEFEMRSPPPANATGSYYDLQLSTCEMYYTVDGKSLACAPGNCYAQIRSPGPAREVRCDSARYSGNMKSYGCGWRGTVPFLSYSTDSGSGVREVALNIREAKTLGAPGTRGGPYLHRIYAGKPAGLVYYPDRQAIINENTRVAVADCDRRYPPGWRENKTYECDEYGFKSTYEGAANNFNYPWRATKVHALQNSKAGGLLSSFYNSWRVLDGDELAVVVAS